MTNLAEFNGQIRAFLDDTAEEELEVFVKKIAFEALARVVKKTPVATGRARGNWQVSHGDPITTQIDREDPTGRETITDGLRVIDQGTKPFGIVYVSNNVDYIYPLENGHSQQAPSGMVGLTVAEIEAAFP